MTESTEVSIVADPGVPAGHAGRMRTNLEERIHERLGPDISVTVATEMLPLDEYSAIDTDIVDSLPRTAGTRHVFVLLTEVPRYRYGRIVLAELDRDKSVAIISCPALGAINVRRRLTTLLMECVERLIADGQPAPGDGRSWADTPQGGGSVVWFSKTWHAPRIIAGMTRANEPLRTAPRLSGAFAAASATGAFGIFYNSIWQMAAYLSAFRLAAIGVLAIAAMVAWLMVGNGLWDRPSGPHRKTLTSYYNCSTILTLLECIVLLYGILFALILIGSLIVIDPRFMAEILGFAPGWREYLEIAWLSAALGVVAGALGASFDRDTEIRRITHGQRERLRRATGQE